MKRRKVHDRGGWLPMYSPRCSLCSSLLCRGEFFLLPGYGAVCRVCRGLVKTTRRKGGLDQAMIDAREARSLAKAKCERDGRCRRRREDT